MMTKTKSESVLLPIVFNNDQCKTDTSTNCTNRGAKEMDEFWVVSFVESKLVVHTCTQEIFCYNKILH